MQPDETFYKWLRESLEKKGHKVYQPFFSTPINQNLEKWMREFKPYKQYVTKDTIFMGKSIGPAFILRLLEKSPVKVRGAFLVAGFCSHIGLEEYNNLIGTFVDKKFNWEKIRSNCDRFFVYASDNDRYVELKYTKILAKNLHTRIKLVKGADHFWMSKFPQLLKDIESVIS